MKLICRFSGIELSIFAERYMTNTGIKTVRYPNFNSVTITNQCHPFFHLSTTSLLTYADKWASRELNEHETRVLFLSLLHSTGLFEFRNIATPSQNFIEANMEYTMKTALWISNINSSKLELPHFIISHATETTDMEQLPIWLGILNDRRDEWYNRFKLSSLKERLAHQEELLDKLIRSPSRAVSSYAARLANWAFTASSLPNETAADKETRERWLAIFRLKGWDIYNADADDIYDLLTYMETNLSAFAGSLQAKTVLDHLRMIQLKNQNGLQRELGMIDGNTFEIVYEDIELSNRKLQALTAPLVEPTEKMIGTNLYPTRVAFLTAKSAWIVAEAEKKRLAEELEKKKEQARAAALDIQTEEEQLAAISEEASAVITGLGVEKSND